MSPPDPRPSIQARLRNRVPLGTLIRDAVRYQVRREGEQATLHHVYARLEQVSDGELFALLQEYSERGRFLERGEARLCSECAEQLSSVWGEWRNLTRGEALGSCWRCKRRRQVSDHVCIELDSTRG